MLIQPFNILALLSVLNRPRFSYRQQSIHVSQVHKKVVMATVESSRSYRMVRWQDLFTLARYLGIDYGSAVTQLNCIGTAQPYRNALVRQD
jgi:hypothetical protein